MKKKTITLYHFDELNEQAQGKVINDTINFYLEAVPYSDMSEEMKKACDKAEEMYTPWFVGEYMLEYAKDEIFATARQYDYKKNGKIFSK